jgi:hypothetical protein
MAEKTCVEVASAGLARVRAEFAAWRQGRQGAERIPDALWAEAVQAARVHGVNCVSRALGLDYNHLKRRAGSDAMGRGRARHSAPTFVELETARSAETLACIVELEKGNGTRMRICVRDTVAVDWGKLKEAFLGA